MFIVLAILIAFCGTGLRAEKPHRINGVIEKLAKGEVVLGTSPADLSLTNAAVLADSPLDFVQIDMEHSPLDFETLRTFMQGMISRREVVNNRSVRPNVVPFVSVPQNGREQLQFMIKQSLDLGAYGMMYAHINTAEEALAAVRASRYPQRKGAPDFRPEGLRGVSPVIASRYWGLPFDEYLERADVWPIDPQGEILVIMQAEEAESVKNIDKILEVPGVGAVFIGPLDLATSLGYPGDPSAPEVQQACARVLQACKRKGIACGIAATADNVERYVKEGYQFIIIGAEGEGLSAVTQRALERVGRVGPDRAGGR
ncbi:MAG: aldolase/citrate lyase family protein [Bryobacterales bacterium]